MLWLCVSWVVRTTETEKRSPSSPHPLYHGDKTVPWHSVAHNQRVGCVCEGGVCVWGWGGGGTLSLTVLGWKSNNTIAWMSECLSGMSSLCYMEECSQITPGCPLIFQQGEKTELNMWGWWIIAVAAAGGGGDTLLPPPPTDRQTDLFSITYIRCSVHPGSAILAQGACQKAHPHDNWKRFLMKAKCSWPLNATVGGCLLSRNCSKIRRHHYGELSLWVLWEWIKKKKKKRSINGQYQ